MLVLTRKTGESVIINGNITVTVLSNTGPNLDKRVRLGIDAPAGVSVHREEIQLRILEEESKKDKTA